jgi:hypothetical protein
VHALAAYMRNSPQARDLHLKQQPVSTVLPHSLVLKPVLERESLENQHELKYWKYWRESLENQHELRERESLENQHELREREYRRQNQHENTS